MHNEVNAMNNSNEKRKTERRKFSYYMRVTDAMTGELIGHLVDISAIGFQLDCTRQIPIGKDFRLFLELSGEIANKSSMTFTARSMWSHPDYLDPTTFKVGFQLILIASVDALIFQRMYEKYTEAKPKHLF
jgi:hypothetical protein